MWCERESIIPLKHNKTVCKPISLSHFFAFKMKRWEGKYVITSTEHCFLRLWVRTLPTREIALYLERWSYNVLCQDHLGYILDWLKSRSLKFHRHLEAQIWLQISQEEVLRGIKGGGGIEEPPRAKTTFSVWFPASLFPLILLSFVSIFCLLPSAWLMVAYTTPHSLFPFCSEAVPTTYRLSLSVTQTQTPEWGINPAMSVPGCLFQDVMVRLRRSLST